jgi:hypothetical protein
MPQQLQPAGQWKEGLALKPHIVEIKQPPNHDLYFTPLRFSVPERHNYTVHRPGVLFADLDLSEPQDPMPHVLWLTSPGRYQAIWFLSRTMDYEEWAVLNKRMTLHQNADQGGWMGSKVLRVPETWNYKRTIDGCTPKGILVHATDSDPYSPKELDYWLPELRRLPSTLSPAQVEDMPSVLDAASWWRVLSEQRWLLPPGAFAELTVPEDQWRTTPLKDRSVKIWQMALTLRDAGISAGDAFHLIHGAVWNKYRDRPHALWISILKAYSS